MPLVHSDSWTKPRQPPEAAAANRATGGAGDRVQKSQRPLQQGMNGGIIDVPRLGETCCLALAVCGTFTGDSSILSARNLSSLGIVLKQGLHSQRIFRGYHEMTSTGVAAPFRRLSRGGFADFDFG